MEQRELRVAELVVARERGQPADVAGQHAGPLDVLDRAVERLGDRGLYQALAQPDAQLATEHLDDGLRRERVGAHEELVQQLRLGGRPRGGLDRRERGGHLGERRAHLGWRCMTGPGEHVLDRQAQVGVAVVRLGQVLAGGAGERADRRHDRRPAEPGGPLVGFREGPPGQEDGRDRQLLGAQAAQVVGQEGGLLGGPGRCRHALGQLAPAAHGGDGIRFRRWRREHGSRRS